MYRIMYITPADTHTNGIYPSGWEGGWRGGGRYLQAKILFKEIFLLRKVLAEKMRFKNVKCDTSQTQVIFHDFISLTYPDWYHIPNTLNFLQGLSVILSLKFSLIEEYP